MKKVFYSFYFKTQKFPFLGVNHFFNFFSIFCFQKKTSLTAKMVFLTFNNTFFVHFQKYQPSEHLCVYCF